MLSTGKQNLRGKHLLPVLIGLNILQAQIEDHPHLSSSLICLHNVRFHGGNGGTGNRGHPF